MKIYKEKSFLVFEFEDGKTVKYDFATKTCIGKKGKKVESLRTQLSGLSIDELCDSCVDKQYGKFLRFVKKYGDYNNRGIYNIGTILNRVPHFSNFEQIFSAGIDEIVDHNFSYKINDIPKGLIRLCKNHRIALSNNFLEYYKEFPDAYLLAYNLEYVSLTDKDIYEILSCNINVWSEGIYRRAEKKSILGFLLRDFGYTAKALFLYCDYCMTYEAIDDMEFLLRELYDYASMMQRISPKFDKYPFIEEDFRTCIKPYMEDSIDGYCFIYPKTTQEIKDEAVSQNNCVASYIKRVMNHECDILFLRKKEEPEKSLVTIEVQKNKIVQARQRFNYPVTPEQQAVIDKWNKRHTTVERKELKNAS